LLCSLLFLIRRKKETRPFFMRGTSNSGGSAPDTAGTIVVQLGTPPVPPSNFVLVLRDPGISGLPSSVPQGYPGCRLPCPRDIRVAAVFRAPGISGSRQFSVTQGFSGRRGFPCPRDIRVAAVFRAPEQFGGRSSVTQLVLATRAVHRAFGATETATLAH
jgi:hypothetical protein